MVGGVLHFRNSSVQTTAAKHGYRIGEPGNRRLNRTHSLFVDDLKQYQESHQKLKDVNEMLVQASHDTEACYGVSKCAEIIFEHGKMKDDKMQRIAGPGRKNANDGSR